MTKRTWLHTLVTTLLISGLAACGGSGGGGGGGSGGVPTATNAAITPPPSTPVMINTAGGVAANQGVAANSFQASDGAKDTGLAAGDIGQVSAQANNGSTQSETLAAIVRRHAERLKDHQPSVTGALQVDTQPCSGGGSFTFAFDDASNNATEVFVNCNEGGTVLHGTLSSSNVGVGPNLGPTVGSPYTISVTATFTIDLSVTPASPASSVVTQGSFTFTVNFSGNMVASGNGGVQPGAPNRVQITMGGASLLTSVGTLREQLSNFSLSVDDNDLLGSTTVTGGYTYANTIMNGSVTVLVSPALVYQPQGSAHPSSGGITITSSQSPGASIMLSVISSSDGVTVAVSDGANPPQTANLSWATIDSL
jgi:hypothetical protein